MTERQKTEIEKLVRNGQLSKLPLDEYRNLSDGQAEEYIARGYATAPLTHKAANKEQKDILRSYISQKILPLNVCDIQNLSSAEADDLLDVAKAKVFEENKTLSQVNWRLGSDTKPATCRQIQRITNLVKDGFLSPVSSENLTAMSKLTARKLIFKGEMKKREGN